MRSLLRRQSTTRDERAVKMADNVIPGLDGDLPPNRGHLPDSLQVKANKRAIVSCSFNQLELESA